MLSGIEKQLLNKLRSNKHLDIAEDGKGFFIIWADGRGQVGYKHKKHAIAFIEQGDRDAVSVVYREREKGETVRNIFTPDKSAIVHDILFKEAEEKKEHRTRITIHEVLFSEAESALLKSVIADRIKNGYIPKWEQPQESDKIPSLQSTVAIMIKKRWKENGIDCRNPAHQNRAYIHGCHYQKMADNIQKWWKNHSSVDLTAFELKLLLKHMYHKTPLDKVSVKNVNTPMLPSEKIPVLSSPTSVPVSNTKTKQAPKSKPMSDPMAVPLSDPSFRYIRKKDTKKRRLLRQQAGLGSIEERLQKAANKLDECSEFTIADKIDLLLQKIQEGKNVREAS